MAESDFTQKINREAEEAATKKKAVEMGVEYLDLAHFPVNPDALKNFEADDLRFHECFPFEKRGKVFRVASPSPNGENAQKFLRALAENGFKTTIFLCSAPALAEAFQIYDQKFFHQKTIEIRENADEKTQNLEAKKADFLALEKRIPDLHPAQVLNEIEMIAISAHASDVHFQPNENATQLRFRIDGVLHDILQIASEKAEKLTLHLKYVGGMVANVSDVPQDGRLSFLANGRKVDGRISVLPTEFGESAVIRILDSRRGLKSFAELGFSEKDGQKIQNILAQKEGLILVSGPTGSGKTTTLYSMLAALSSPEKKIVTLEDPIEYHLPGIAQSPINPEKGFDFASGLRSLLRHDPDIILVGEIRDRETAMLALEASLTGHGVLSSIHTNSAVAAIERLRNLGAEDFTIAPTINAIFAQRLVRRICPHCGEKETLKLDEKQSAAVKRLQAVFPDLAIPKFVPKKSEHGCETCSQTGFLGQMAVSEILVFDQKIQKMILNKSPEFEILEYLRAETDYLTLFESGVLQVLSGQTTFAEVARGIS